jgi:hypothetical protein
MTGVSAVNIARIKKIAGSQPTLGVRVYHNRDFRESN